MTRRVLRAIVAVTAAAVLLFGVPLAFGAYRLYRNEATVRLEREAARAALAVPASFARSDDPVELPPASRHTALALYDRDGRRVLGTGPVAADTVVRAALGGRVGDAELAEQIVVAVPLSSNEQVYAAIRAATPTDTVLDRAEKTWLAMLALALAVICTAAAAARSVARRLSRPVHELAGTARRLGDGDFTARAKSSGVPELDDATDALNLTAERLGQVLARERAFSADASHQLRTPLTALRVRLEAVLLNPSGDWRGAVEGALADIDHLQTTVEDLLALARDTATSRQAVDVEPLVADAERRWHGQLAEAGRPLRLVVAGQLPRAYASRAAVTQILDVLLDNATRHGEGTVTITCRSHLDEAVAIDVSDEGAGPPSEDLLFRRRSPDAAGTGIGLALARSLAEADGGRLFLSHGAHPCVFTLLMTAASPNLRTPAQPSRDRPLPSPPRHQRSPL